MRHIVWIYHSCVELYSADLMPKYLNDWRANLAMFLQMTAYIHDMTLCLLCEILVFSKV